jgi:hypothetical protein|tara:strand:- start:2844 stop:3059 length:216 start_codon:yes stop_codon:yes gene_type:complete
MDKMSYDDGKLINKIVLVDFDEVVLMTGINDFNDYLCELTEEDCLQDVSWEVCGHEDGAVKLSVSGYAEEE